MRPVAQIHPELAVGQIDEARKCDERRVREHVETDVLAEAFAENPARFEDVVAKRAAVGPTREVFAHQIVILAIRKLKWQIRPELQILKKLSELGKNFAQLRWEPV